MPRTPGIAKRTRTRATHAAAAQARRFSTWAAEIPLAELKAWRQRRSRRSAV